MVVSAQLLRLRLEDPRKVHWDFISSAFRLTYDSSVYVTSTARPRCDTARDTPMTPTDRRLYYSGFLLASLGYGAQNLLP
jgi:hypothetical protein